MVTRAVLSILLLVGLMGMAGPGHGHAAPLTAESLRTASPITKIHGCHVGTFFDDRGWFHRHEQGSCRAVGVRPPVGIDVCSDIARQCERFCRGERREGRCLRRCYRRNAPRAC